MPALVQTPAIKSVDSSSWFDSFSLLVSELENAPPSDLPSPLVEKLEENHFWFLDTVNRFKPPSQASKDALNSPEIAFGAHKLSVKPELRDFALSLSSVAYLDEVQSYILVERFTDQKIGDLGGLLHGSLHEIFLQYYVERQCLLKCTRYLIAQAVQVESDAKEANAIQNMVAKLVSDGLESKLMSILHELLTLCPPQNMDVDFYILWAEEVLIEVNLVLDILFLTYYESFCTCGAGNWKKLCLLYKGMLSGSFNFGKLGVSEEALNYSYNARVLLLLILMECLDLETLLQMIHDDIPFRGSSFVFSLSHIQEMDAEISSINVFQTKEAGPLVLTWAIFLCLVTSISAKEDLCELKDVDHVGYVRQAFEVGSLSYFLEILQSDVLKDSDGPVAGCRSILRTFISAFIASYEINVQVEDNILRSILAILCEIYRGEESLCAQFWDRDSITDAPIRTLLCGLEIQFPYRINELTRFLAALSKGTWPADCVYNFLHKSAGISFPARINDHLWVDSVSQVVEAQVPLVVPGIDGLVIPRSTRGQVVRMIDGNTALIRWQYKKSGVLVLLMRLAQKLNHDRDEEALVILDLFCRLASSNMGLCFKLMSVGKPLHISGPYENSQDSNIWIDVVEVLCDLVRSLTSYSENVSAMSMGVGILAKMLKCSPSYVSTVVLKKNIFDASQTSIFNLENDGFSSDTWILSGMLAKMLLIDCEKQAFCPLTISVLDFTMQLVGAEVDQDFVLALVIFCIQYVFVNHEHWKYMVKQSRWKVTLKALELLKISIEAIPRLTKIGEGITHIVLSDSSIHNTLFRIVCTTSEDLEKLYVSRLFDLREIEGWQLSICLVMQIYTNILTNFPEDEFSGPHVFLQAILSPNAELSSAVVALASLMSYFRDPGIQLGAARVLSLLCVVAYHSQSHLSLSVSFSIGDRQMMKLRNSIEKIICESSMKHEDLFVATVNLLFSAANCQPAFLAGILTAEGPKVASASDDVGEGDLSSEGSPKTLKCKSAVVLLDVLLSYFERSEVLINSNVRVLLSLLNFIKALWQGSVQYEDILVYLRKSDKFWKHMSEIVSLVTHIKAPSPRKLAEPDAQNLALKYHCQSAALDILALEIFLQKKHSHADMLAEQANRSTTASSGDLVSSNKPESANSNHLKHILLSWSDSSIVGDLVRSSAAYMYDNGIYHQAKMASSLFAAYVVGKLSTGDAGSLTASFAKKINNLFSKLLNQPAFSMLLDQYSCRGYSEGVKMQTLIISDLYHHMQGELEGRKLESGPFKELCQVLADSDIWNSYKKKCNVDLLEVQQPNLFDISHLQHDLGLDMWDYSEWKTHKVVAETALVHLQESNSMLLLGASKIYSVKALTMVLSLNLGDPRDDATTFFKVPKDQILLSINHLCQEFLSTVESLIDIPDGHKEVFDYLAAETELLLCLIRHINGSIPLSTCKTVLKVSGFALKAFCQSNALLVMAGPMIKFLLMLLLLVVESSYSSAGSTKIEFAQDLGEVSNACLGLLPILCICCGISGHEVLSLTCVDVILKMFTTPNTWLPIIQKHLQLQSVLLKLQDERFYGSVPLILKFLLNVAQAKEGAEMLLDSGFLTSLGVLFEEKPENLTSPANLHEKSALVDKSENPQNIWGLSLSILTAIICSLGESSLGADYVHKTVRHLFMERGFLIAYHLSAPGFPSDEHDKKRARAQKKNTPLSVLRGTEDALILLCVLANHRNSWLRATKETDSELRERIIHVLAFISRGNRYPGELPSWDAPLICLPVSKEEIGCCKKAAFVGSKKGWFALSALGCPTGPNFSSDPIKSMAIVVKDQAIRSSGSLIQSHFSDVVAVQLYRIAFLLLKFLCLEAKDAARRSEGLGYVDLSRTPELPVPEILHGLQDQAISIVSELCGGNKSKLSEPEVQGICLLLLEIAEMALYLELCVSQTCGMRPVSGRVEDFTKEIRFLTSAAEGHAFLKSSVKQLKQIISFVYPGLLQSEGMLV